MPGPRVLRQDKLLPRLLPIATVATISLLPVQVDQANRSAHRCVSRSLGRLVVLGKEGGRWLGDADGPGPGSTSTPGFYHGPPLERVVRLYKERGKKKGEDLDRRRMMISHRHACTSTPYLRRFQGLLRPSGVGRGSLPTEWAEVVRSANGTHVARVTRARPRLIKGEEAMRDKSRSVTHPDIQVCTGCRQVCTYVRTNAGVQGLEGGLEGVRLSKAIPPPRLFSW
ncbi:hypothetical protein GGS23DRAFT_271761 [Durotheca rogersii]|uniref:uncharacterized protein n=1 Tax=Durotheca rogersii TaxID=419775 RepID=UPI00221EAF1F|nr:uncharacterized protein GGS23DRAFT_271761 [Durotheca rogersii]KAI5866440.1 hypothetical protein GGS23DRAFT_271761 [Durotheca rogersii]